MGVMMMIPSAFSLSTRLVLLRQAALDFLHSGDGVNSTKILLLLKQARKKMSNRLYMNNVFFKKPEPVWNWVMSFPLRAYAPVCKALARVLLPWTNHGSVTKPDAVLWEAGSKAVVSGSCYVILLFVLLFVHGYLL